MTDKAETLIKDKAKEEIFWIYPGERRPVIVQAKNKRHAEHKIRLSPDYDGFPILVYPVETFAKMCVGTKVIEEKEFPPEPPKVEPPKHQEFYMIVCVVDGLSFSQVRGKLDEAVIVADEWAKRANPDKDEIRIFRYTNTEREEGNSIYIPGREKFIEFQKFMKKTDWTNALKQVEDPVHVAPDEIPVHEGALPPEVEGDPGNAYDGPEEGADEGPDDEPNP